MNQEIQGFYDLTEAAKDVWKDINPDLDTPPTDEDLDFFRKCVQSFFAWTAKRLGEGKTAHFDQCGTFALKLRAGVGRCRTSKADVLKYRTFSR